LEYKIYLGKTEIISIDSKRLLQNSKQRLCTQSLMLRTYVSIITCRSANDRQQ